MLEAEKREKEEEDAPASSSNQQSSKRRDNLIIVNSSVPKIRQNVLKWNGWGYTDSKFVYNGVDAVTFTGNRYPIANQRFPLVAAYVRRNFDIDLAISRRPPQPEPTDAQLPRSRITKPQLERIEHLQIGYSLRAIDRLVRSHGQTLHDVYRLRRLQVARIPDVVLWPAGHADVVRLVAVADALDMVVLAFGGGTAVSGAVETPANEARTIISLDTSQMNRILWIDRSNLLACCESGIIGQDLERELNVLGYTSGHEPDSYEFSSLGGWVATRASGMKKNVYGNIEDILVHAKLVTPSGVLQKNCQVPRMSCGPDFNHIILGSEGSLGIITEVVIKIRPLAKCQRFGSLVFPDFEAGLRCMREVALRRCQPSSIRLMDNGQMQFGMILKPEASYFGLMVDGVKKFYLTKIRRFDWEKMCVMTLLFEGEEEEVRAQEKKVYGIGKGCGGLPAGETNGRRGYMFTFVIAYIRDLALDCNIVAESFETSVPWDRALKMVENVKRTIDVECKKIGIRHYLINCRITQTYDAGCVIYFYLGFKMSDLADPIGVHNQLETSARDEIIACGGSISHHHGVGKLRQKWYPETVSQVGVDLYRATKRQLDPKNIFATNNLVKAKL